MAFNKKEYMREYNARYRASHIEAIKANDAAYREANRDKIRIGKEAWRKANLDKAKIRISSWKKVNPNFVRSAVKARRRKIRHQIPVWVSLPDIKRVYRGCPEGMVVDHQIPLKAVRDGVHVACGLHAPANMQYLDPLCNIEKSNNIDHPLCYSEIHHGI